MGDQVHSVPCIILICQNILGRKMFMALSQHPLPNDLCEHVHRSKRCWPVVVHICYIPRARTSGKQLVSSCFQVYCIRIAVIVGCLCAVYGIDGLLRKQWQQKLCDNIVWILLFVQRWWCYCISIHTDHFSTSWHIQSLIFSSVFMGVS